FQNSYEASRIQAVNAPFMTFLWMVALVVTVWYGGFEINQGRLGIGDLAAFLLYLTYLQMPVRSMGFMLNVFARAQSSGARIFEVLDAQSAVVERPGARALDGVEDHVRFEGVHFAYDAVSPILQGIEIDARPGSVTALLGPTGSGKTTIVNLLPRFYDVTTGRVTIDGVDIRDVALASLRRAVGIVQQDPFLFSATIRDNIAYGVPEARDEDVVAAAKAARIHDFVMSLPQGYNTWVGERGITLSGGQKQRVAIARTLLRNPRILILDDSTSSVDPETERLIQEALVALMRGRTTFVIAHRLRTVKEADQVLVLQEGRIVERGRHQDLLERGGFYRRIYELELKAQEEAALITGGTGTTSRAGGS
ncbi:MAG TPA: ABC transporter ATP-binding protein, partial [Dehalococcoidia bacterium]|nr:ABC transporter ATP-binding protein [Dehalococcoidia bacterium]